MNRQLYELVAEHVWQHSYTLLERAGVGRGRLPSRLEGGNGLSRAVGPFRLATSTCAGKSAMTMPRAIINRNPSSEISTTGVAFARELALDKSEDGGESALRPCSKLLI